MYVWVGLQRWNTLKDRSDWYEKYFSLMLCRKTLLVTYYCYIQERDEGAGKGMVIARTDKWNNTERWGNETEVRKSVYHKLRHLNYNFKARHPRRVFLCQLNDIIK
jgi:hypothetical protein